MKAEGQSPREELTLELAVEIVRAVRVWDDDFNDNRNPLQLLRPLLAPLLDNRGSR